MWYVCNITYLSVTLHGCNITYMNVTLHEFNITYMNVTLSVYNITYLSVYWTLLYHSVQLCKVNIASRYVFDDKMGIAIPSELICITYDRV